MSADYRVDVTIGPDLAGQTWTWTVHRGDPVTAFPVLLDGMSFEWGFPDANVWPVQPDPVTAKFSILAEDAADLDGIDRGTPVLIRVWAGFTLDGQEFDSVTFPGRVSDPVGTPITFTHPVTGLAVDGWRLDLTCVDITVDLAEYSYSWVPRNAMPPYNVHTHTNGLLASVGLPPMAWGDGGDGQEPRFAFGEVDQGTNVLQSLVDMLGSYADGGYFDPFAGGDVATNYTLYASQGWRRGIIQANTDDDGIVNPAAPYRVDWVSRRYGLQPGIGPAAPGEFGNSGSGYGIVLTPPPPSIVVGGVTIPVGDGGVVASADYVDYAAKWTRTKFDDPNRVNVPNTITPASDTGLPVYDWLTVAATNQQPGEAPVVADIAKNRILRRYDAEFVAEMYLGDPDDPGVLWAASGFRWYASQDPSWPTGRALFPACATWGGYAAPVVITDIPATQLPNGRRWYVGVLKSVTWTFGGGEFDIAFDLFPRIPRPLVTAGIALTWAELETYFPTVTWAQLDESDWLEYRLARSAVYS